jgi:hypothetical protein
MTMPRGTERGWKRPFEDPVPLPRSRQLVTLEDAARYIQKLPKAEQETPEWQAATEALIMAAEGRGPLMHARIGVLRALNRNVERTFNSDSKTPIGASASSRGTNENCGIYAG